MKLPNFKLAPSAALDDPEALAQMHTIWQANVQTMLSCKNAAGR